MGGFSYSLFLAKKEVQELRDFSQEEIQNAAKEVRRSNFGDFMFRDPGFNRRTTRRRTSSNRHTSRRNTSKNRHTSRKNTSKNRVTTRRLTSRRHTSRRVTSRRLRCFNSTEGNYLVKRCFEDSNMALFIRRKR